MPGSGKTHIVTTVADASLAEHSLNALSAPIAYFYCGDSRFGRNWADPDELMRSLTQQLAIVDKKTLKIHESISLTSLFLLSTHAERRKSLNGFDMPKLRCAERAGLILGILGANPAVIIVDGVDEIEERRRHEFLESITGVRDESASVVTIFSLQSRKQQYPRSFARRLEDSRSGS